VISHEWWKDWEVFIICLKKWRTVLCTSCFWSSCFECIIYL
jgi:hypothetical protein